MPTLWPFMPETISESLGFLTEVLRGDAAEQRRALRAEPRQSLSLVWQPTEEEVGAAQLVMRSNIAGDWYVPYWPDAIRAGSVSSGASSISVDASNRDFRDGGYVAVWSDWDDAEVIALTSVGSGVLNLGGTTSKAYSDAFVAPVLTGYTTSGLDWTREDTRHISASVTFGIRGEVDIGATTYDQYSSADVLTDRPVSVSSLESAVSQELAIVDNSTGPVRLEALRSYLRDRATLSFEDETAAAKWTRRRWLYKIKGRQKHFWLPTWNQDLKLAASIGSADTAITVTMRPGMSGADDRHILIELTDGTRFYRQITAVMTGATTADLSISALGQAVTAADIRQICFLNKTRLDADNITLTHDGLDRTLVTVPTVEVP